MRAWLVGHARLIILYAFTVQSLVADMTLILLPNH